MENQQQQPQNSVNASPTLLVLAAGMGNRYGGLKQIDPVGPNGEALLDYSIFDAQRAGFSKVVLVIRKEMEKAFRELADARFGRSIAVDYAFQELDLIPPEFSVPSNRSKPWGTAHAVLSAANIVNSPFAVINADDFYGAASYNSLAAHWNSGNKDYALVGFSLRNTLSEHGAVARAICDVSTENHLKSIVETLNITPVNNRAQYVDPDGIVHPLTADEIVSMNMWGFSPVFFDQLNQYFHAFLSQNISNEKAECYLPGAVNDLVQTQQAQVRVLRSSSSWFGVTYREDRERVKNSISTLIQSGAYPERLWK